MLQTTDTCSISFAHHWSILKENDVQTTFHYLPLHSSKYYADKYYGAELPNCDYYSDCLVRLPLYYELTDLEVKKIIKHIIEFCSKN